MICPFCAEEIKDNAIKCKHCNEFLNKKPNFATIESEITGCLVKVVTIFIPGVAQLIETNYSKAVVYFSLAFIGSPFTFGITWLIFGIISCIDTHDMYRCSICKGKIDWGAKICRNCKSSISSEGWTNW